MKDWPIPLPRWNSAHPFVEDIGERAILRPLCHFSLARMLQKGKNGVTGIRIMYRWIIPILVSLLAVACSEESVETSRVDIIPSEPSAVATPAGEYGLELENFEVKKGRIGRNQFLAEILLKEGVGYPIIESLVELAKPILDVRKIRAGDHYALVSQKDTSDRLAYFIYEEDPVNYVVFDLNENLAVYAGAKEVETIEKHAQGEITTSLYDALSDLSADPMLAL